MAIRFSTHAAKIAGLGLGASALAACSTTGETQPQHTSHSEYYNSIGAYANPKIEDSMDPVASAAYWGTRYNRDHADPEVAVSFSAALRKIGSVDEAIRVMQKASTKNPNNTEVSLEFGKALIEADRAFEAVRHVEKAAAEQPNNWRALSAYGVALDNIGEHELARRQYDRALSLEPGSISLLNNKGLSFAMDGDLKMAEKMLKFAASSPGADARIRQNLALVNALRGDMEEATRLARSDLPPQVANNNIDVFRNLVNQPAYWGEFASTVDVPEFDQTPVAPTPQTAPAPTKKPQMLEQPQSEETKDDDTPIALIEAAPVTNASVIKDVEAPVATADDKNDVVAPKKQETPKAKSDEKADAPNDEEPSVDGATLKD
ncbi:MAG: hypothetical protein AAGB02_05510 [Pseudomonadota bacterium]